MARFTTFLLPIVLAMSLASGGACFSQHFDSRAPEQVSQTEFMEVAQDGPDTGPDVAREPPRPQETLLITDRPGPALEINWATDLVGGDYESGATNAQLSDIGVRECHVLCMLDDRCKAYTHSGSTRICKLKNAAGEKRELSGFISTIFVDRQVATRQSSSVYRGRLAMSYDPSLTWWQDDTAETYIRRTRDAARPYGADCDSEMEDLRAVAIDAIVGSSATVGETMQIKWSGNGLVALDPVWLMISTKSPVRFAGKGFHGLNKGAFGPFGMDTAQDETRALVPLYNQAVGDSGSIGVVPLEAGETTLAVTVVAYLRQCQKVVELERTVETVSVQPAAPRIVLHNPYALNIYPHKAEIAPLKRRVLYNDDRFLILETELDGEILERSGSGIHFSPTGRYVAVRSDNATEIVDVIDGDVVARIGDNMSVDQELMWLHGDSFVAVTRPPYGRVWLASTLNPGRPAYYTKLGRHAATCCRKTASSTSILRTTLSGCGDQMRALPPIWPISNSAPIFPAPPRRTPNLAPPRLFSWMRSAQFRRCPTPLASICRFRRVPTPWL